MQRWGEWMMGNHKRNRTAQSAHTPSELPPLTAEEALKQAQLTPPPSADAVVGESPEVRRLRAILERAAATRPMDATDDSDKEPPIPVPPGSTGPLGAPRPRTRPSGHFHGHSDDEDCRSQQDEDFELAAVGQPQQLVRSTYSAASHPRRSQ